MVFGLAHALDLYPKYKKMIAHSTMPLEAAVRLAIAGNIIDLGPGSEIDQSGIDGAIGDAWSGRLQGNMGLLAKLPDQLKIFFIRETTAVKFDFEGRRRAKNYGAVQ